MTRISDLIRETAEGWAEHSYGLPSTVEVRDWGMAGCSRWAVVLTFAPNRDEFLCECGTLAQANRTAGQYRRHLESCYERSLAACATK